MTANIQLLIQPTLVSISISSRIPKASKHQILKTDERFSLIQVKVCEIFLFTSFPFQHCEFSEMTLSLFFEVFHDECQFVLLLCLSTALHMSTCYKSSYADRVNLATLSMSSTSSGHLCFASLMILAYPGFLALINSNPRMGS